MADLNTSLCITCLSTVDDGASISASMQDFLRKELHFKCRLEEMPYKLVCRNCYRTLIEIKRFCLQLRDVELYYECKSKGEQINDENDLIEELDEIEELEEVEEAISIDFDTTHDDAEQMNDPILIDAIPEQQSPPLTVPTTGLNIDYHVVESSEGPPPMPNLRVKTKETKAKQIKFKEVKAKEKRFVCLICSKLFSSIHDLRSHENTHTTPSNPKTVPIFLQARRQKTCPECGEHFDIMREFLTHVKHHELDKTKPFRCFKCSRRFLTIEALRDHDLVHTGKKIQMSQCDICHKQYLNKSSLDAHMRLSHMATDDNAPTEVTSMSIEQLS